MNLASSSSAEAQALGQLRLELPATAHVLALRLSEIGDRPLSSIRGDRSVLARLSPAVREILSALAPQVRRELGGVGRRRLSHTFGRGLTRYMMRKNQYLPLPCDWDHTAETLYSMFVDDLADRLSSRSGADEAVSAHQPRLRCVIAARGGGVLAQEVLCEAYSPELQLHLLGLDPSHTPGPILDVGCGEGGLLVRHMQRLGRGDVYGLDALCATGGGLTRGSWFGAPLAPGGWGTIIAHQSFSLHFLHAHVRGSDADAGRHARAFVRLLQSLK